MGKRKTSRIPHGLGFGFLLAILLVGGAIPVLAWHPAITADYECLPDGTYQVSGHVGPWDGPNLDDLTNSKIEIHRGSYDGPLVDFGAFVIVNDQVSGFYWTDLEKIPGDAKTEVTYVVSARAPWNSNGEAPRGPDNLHRDQTVVVSLPGTCLPQEATGEIIVKKVTNTQTDEEFAFKASWLEDEDLVFTLSNGGEKESGRLLPGTYSVTESAHSGWTSQAVCDHESSPAAIILQAGETVTCTFTNTKKPDTETPPPTLTVTPTPTGAIGDWVWLDTDGDGYQADFEEGVEGVEVNLLDGAGMVIATTSTDDSGHYLFSGLPAGTYEVQFIVPAGYDVSPLRQPGVRLDWNSDAGPAGTTGLIALAAGQSDETWDAGIVPVRPTQVLPQVITATTATSTTVAQTSETLPFTGITDSLVGGVAVALLMLGGLVLLSIRRREQDAIVVADDWFSRLNVYTLKY